MPHLEYWHLSVTQLRAGPNYYQLSILRSPKLAIDGSKSRLVQQVQAKIKSIYELVDF